MTEISSPDPYLIVSRDRVHTVADQARILAARHTYEQQSVLRLRGFLDPCMLDMFQRRVAAATFSRRVEEGREIEHTLEEPALVGLFMLALNDPALFSAVEALTGCERIGRFSGRVQSRHADAGGGHYYPWHSDAVQGRLVGLSINLSQQAFSGGVLQLRRAGTETILAGVANTHPGDAVLFRISTELEHQVTPITGAGTRMVLAGWFRAAPAIHWS